MTDLLAGMQDEPSKNVTDLLEGMDESGAASWVPEAAGDGIQGVVKSLTTTNSDYTDQPVPVVVLEGAKATVNGQAVENEAGEFRITAYAGVLQRELKDNQLAVGDTLAVKYFGKKTSKSGNGYHHYKTAAAKGKPAPAATESTNGSPF